MESSFDVDTFDVVLEQSQENEGFDIQSVHEGKKPHECEHYIAMKHLKEKKNSKST